MPASAATGGRPGLDAPPPLPPSLRTPDYTGLANQVTPPGTPLSGQLATMAVSRGALVVKLLTSLAEMLPSFAAPAAQMSQALQAALMASIQKDSQGGGPGAGGPPAPAPPPPAAAPPGVPQAAPAAAGAPPSS